MAAYRSEIIYTPPMVANWAKVLGPARKRDDNDPAKWSIDLLCDPNDEATTKLRDQIRSFMVEAHGAKPKISANGMPLKRHEEKNDHGEKEPTGMLVLKASRKLENRAQGIENAPPLVLDSQCNPWPVSELIGNGSTVIAKVHFWGWSRTGEGVGLSCELHGVQVIKHVAYNREEPADGGFGVVAGGAVAPQVAEIDQVFADAPDFAERQKELAQQSMDDGFGQKLAAAAQAVEGELPF